MNMWKYVDDTTIGERMETRKKQDRIICGWINKKGKYYQISVEWS